MPTMRRTIRHRLLGPFWLLVAGLLAAGPSAAAPLQLEGTWYVLVHFRDSATANPDSDRWLDLVWVFSRKGSRLQWTEYPMVVFADTSGRFEARRGNPRSRVLAAWEPNAAQRRTIDRGPTVGQRGSKTKSLSGSNEQGWRTTRRRPPGGSAGSAMVIGYQEKAVIEGLGGLPVFERQDVFGNGTQQTTEGYTLFAVTEIDEKGRLHGRFERDDHRRGRFRMWRTPPMREPTRRARSWEEKQTQMVEDLIERAARGDVDAQRQLRELQALVEGEPLDETDLPSAATPPEEEE
jgi:hypothetical protein